MDKLEQLVNQYNQPYSLDDDQDQNDTNMKRQKIRLEIMKMLPDLLEDMKELNRLFDVQHKRTQEADKLWQEEHNKPDIIPDLGELISWLLDEIDGLKITIDNQSAELGAKQLHIEELEEIINRDI